MGKGKRKRRRRRQAASKRGERADGEPAEKAPRQPGVVGKDDALSRVNHAAYIALHFGPDNKARNGVRARKRGRERPLTQPVMSGDYFSAAASPSVGPLLEASAMRAFLPRKPRR